MKRLEMGKIEAVQQGWRPTCREDMSVSVGKWELPVVASAKYLR